MSQTVTDYATGTPLYRILGGGGGGGDSATAESMTTSERMALTPDAGFLIWDTDLEKLFIGDGSTAGGVAVQGGGGEGTVTGIEASVSGNTATITATGSTTSVKLTGTGGVDVKGNTNTGDVEFDLNNAITDANQNVVKELQNARFIRENAATPLTLLHFSDIHGNKSALARITADATAFGNLIDAKICTGDIVETYPTGPLDWWDSSVMIAIGNHDCANSSQTNWNALSIANRIAYYISPYESSWGITRGEGADYYYKDYATQKVRLIVLELQMYLDSSTATEASAQTSWLTNLLADAITNNLHVLIACHAPATGAVAVKCSFTRFNQTPFNETESYIPASIVTAVASAINSGLKFCGYICGHMHADRIWDATGNGTQYCYNVCTASTAQAQWINWGDQWRENADGYDSYNLVTIDTSNTLVKIIKGGGTVIDNILRQRQTITINYSTGEIIDRERPLFAHSAGVATSAETAALADAATIANGVGSSVAGRMLEAESGILNVKRYMPYETVTGASVTLQAGFAYKLTATSAITLNTETVPVDSYGEGHIDIYTTNASNLIMGSMVTFVGNLATNQWNSCTIRFTSTGTKIFLDFKQTVYIVTQNTDLTNGSLYYGLVSAPDSDIMIDATLDGVNLNLGGATVTAQKSVTGNGIASSFLTGSVEIGAGGSLQIDQFGLSDVTFTGGTPALGGTYVADGTAVNVTAGGIALTGSMNGTSGVLNLGSGTVLDLTGNASAAPVTPGTSVFFSAGGATVYPSAGSAAAYSMDNLAVTSLGNTNVVDLNQSRVYASGGTHKMSNVIFSNGRSTSGGAGGIMTLATITSMTDCTVTGCTTNTGDGGGVQIGRDGTNYGSGYISGCTISKNYTSSGNGGGVMFGQGCTGIMSNCLIDSCTAAGSSKTGGGVLVAVSANVTLRDCTLMHCSAYYAPAIGIGHYVTVTIDGCTITDMYSNEAGIMGPDSTGTASFSVLNIAGSNYFGTSIILRGATINFGGSSYFMYNLLCDTLNISSGAILNHSGNSRVIQPTTGIVVSEGGFTYITSGGQSVHINGGTYTQINPDGTTA